MLAVYVCFKFQILWPPESIRFKYFLGEEPPPPTAPPPPHPTHGRGHMPGPSPQISHPIATKKALKHEIS